MQRKITLAWSGGSIGIEGNRVAIRQGNNVVYVVLEQADAFLADVQSAFDNLPKPEPTSGFGGTISPIAPKKPKSMDDILTNMAFIAKGWTPIP